MIPILGEAFAMKLFQHAVFRVIIGIANRNRYN